MDDGLNGDVPLTVDKLCLTGTIGDDAVAAGNLDGVARAGTNQVLGGHHQSHAVYFGLVNHFKGAVNSVLGVVARDGR